MARQEVRDHEHHRVAELPEGAPGRRRGANKALESLSGKALPANVLDPAWKSIAFLDDPLAATLDTQAEHSVASGLLDETDLKGIYDLRPLNKVLKAEGKDAVDDAGLGVK